MCAIPEPAAGDSRVAWRARMRVFLAGRHRRDRPAARADAARPTGHEVTRHDALAARSSTRCARPAPSRWSPTRSTRDAVRAAVRAARPDAVIHQLTALPPRIDPRKMERDFVLNDRLRSEGTRNLVAAAQAAGAGRIIAQSIAFAYAPGPAGHACTSRPIRCYLRRARSRSGARPRRVAELERAVLGAGGMVLRYGYFYGPGSAIAPRRLDGGRTSRAGACRSSAAARGVWSFIHVDDAAARHRRGARPQGGRGAYNVVDDEPAPVAQWLPALAEALGAPRPRRVPALIARLVAGSYGVTTMTRAQGASNELAKRELGLDARSYPSWREGFRSGL